MRISASTATSRPSILEVPGAKDVAVEIFSMSKSYNMAGWRVGFCLGQREDDRRAGAHQELSRLRRVSADPDRVDRRPARVRRRDTKKICAIYQQRRDVLVDGLCRAGWPVESPRGTMFLWAPIPERYPRSRVARILEAAAWKRRSSPSPQASASGRWAKASCASP